MARLIGLLKSNTEMNNDLFPQPFKGWGKLIIINIYKYNIKKQGGWFICLITRHEKLKDWQIEFLIL